MPLLFKMQKTLVTFSLSLMLKVKILDIYPKTFEKLEKVPERVLTLSILLKLTLRKLEL